MKELVVNAKLKFQNFEDLIRYIEEFIKMLMDYNVEVEYLNFNSDKKQSNVIQYTYSGTGDKPFDYTFSNINTT